MDTPNESVTDWGHRGPVDRTQILRFLSLTPEERWRKHEEWRMVLRAIREHARIVPAESPSQSR